MTLARLHLRDVQRNLDSIQKALEEGDTEDGGIDDMLRRLEMHAAFSRRFLSHKTSCEDRNKNFDGR